MKLIEDLQNDNRNDKVFILTLSEFVNILKIMCDPEKNDFERENEIAKTISFSHQEDTLTKFLQSIL